MGLNVTQLVASPWRAVAGGTLTITANTYQDIAVSADKVPRMVLLRVTNGAVGEAVVLMRVNQDSAGTDYDCAFQLMTTGAGGINVNAAAITLGWLTTNGVGDFAVVVSPGSAASCIEVANVSQPQGVSGSYNWRYTYARYDSVAALTFVGFTANKDCTIEYVILEAPL